MDILPKQARPVIMIQRQWLSYKGMSGPMAIIQKQVRAYGYHILAGKALWSYKGSSGPVVIIKRQPEVCSYQAKANQGLFVVTQRQVRVRLSYKGRSGLLVTHR